MCVCGCMYVFALTLQARGTRSKLRLNKVHVPPSVPTESSSDDVSTPSRATPVRSTRSKMRENKAAAPQPSDDDDGGDSTGSATKGVDCRHTCVHR